MLDQPLAGVTVLWVEDDSFLAEFITKTLSDGGAKVTYVNTGEQALEKIKDDAFDVALIDILLPGTSGWDVITAIRGSEDKKNVPIIVFSNLGSQEDVNKGIELGADRFIVKSSIHPKELITEIEKARKARGGAEA